MGNAFGYVEAGDPGKASEFLWGSMAQALKAVAATKGVQLRGHSQVREYARLLAQAQNDATIWDVFRKAEMLHRNFYELGTELEEVAILSLEVRATVSKLLGFIK